MHDGEKSSVSERKRPVHLPISEGRRRSIIVFLTVCTKDRQCVLATSTMHRVLGDAWQSAQHWTVGRYVLMPDHLHLFCSPGIWPPEPMASWVRFWKSSVSKTMGVPAGTLWQRDFWDTQLRQHESYFSKWEYVRNNPVRAKLAHGPDDWLFQGEINVLSWDE